MLRVFPLMFMIFSLKVYPHSNSNNLKSAAVIWGAKQTPISGSVKDASGTPIPGVNILLVGTVTGTQTDYI
ncbi:hypothetical protein [Arenibacter certesii]|nr:hypothetical protein [Arenibacter certesii]